MTKALIALLGVQLMAQTPVSVLVPLTTLHDHYLFNSSNTYDGQDYAGLPWLFYFVNVNASPSPSTLRTRCALQQINGTPYSHANFGWFRFPVPGGNGTWPAANWTEPLAATGEYLETAKFGPIGSTNPVGFIFNGEFAGQTSPPSSPTHPYAANFFVEAVYFTDRECSDAGTEYGWFREVANSYSGDTPTNSITFYYSEFSNCNIDYGCWDTNGHQLGSPVATATITSLAPNNARTFQYKYQATRSGSAFQLSILDPSSGVPVHCQWSLSTGGGSSGACQFSLPIQSWYPPATQTQNGYIVVATQSSHIYPAATGQPYQQWYDYAGRGFGAAPPTNVIPTTEPNGTKSCLTGGVGYACLNAQSLAVLYE